MSSSETRPFLCSILSLLVCAAFAQTTQAAGRVQGFESGDPAVTSTGDAGVVDGSYQQEAPPEGSRQFLLTTIGMMRMGEDDLVPQVGGFAVSNFSLQQFFGTGLNGQEGSGVLIPFTVSAGDSLLTFQFDFLTNEFFQTMPRPDFAFAEFISGNSVVPNSFTQFADVGSLISSNSFTTFGDQSNFVFHTGYRTLTLSVANLAPGDYSLGIGIADAVDVNHASGLLIDNVQIAAAVPEPSTIGLAIAGAILLLGVRRRIKGS